MTFFNRPVKRNPKDPEQVLNLFKNLEDVEKEYLENKKRILAQLIQLIPKSHIADRLNMDRKTLYNQLRKLGLHGRDSSGS